MILDVHADIVGGTKQSILLAIAAGAQLAGFKVNLVRCNHINPNNCSLLWRYPNQGETILENIVKAKEKNKLFFINSNYFKAYHIDPSATLTNEYYRIMWKSIYDNEAIYPDKPENIDRVNFYRYHNYDLKPWNKNGDTVLIIANKVGTFGCNGINVQEWIDEQIEECRREGYEKIVVQLHPLNTTLKIKNNVTLEKGNLKNTLKKYNIKFAIIYNSGACTECLIEGIPTFIKGPNSPAKNFSNMQNMHDIGYNVDRHKFIKEASYKMWNIEDIKLGKPWKSLLEKYEQDNIL